MEDFLYRWISLIGFFVISFIAWMTGTKTKINLNTVIYPQKSTIIVRIL